MEAAKRELYRYQKTGVWRIHRMYRGRPLLADEMGLGKTIQSIMYAKVFLDKGPYVVVCPASVKYNWQDEVNMCGMRAVVLEKTTPKQDVVDAMLKVRDRTFYILNYDILGEPVGAQESWSKVIMRLKPTLVILDECHMLGNPTSKRSRRVKEMTRKVKSIIGISGTPLTHRPIQLWPILNILHPKDFPSYKRFGERYCKPRMTPWGPRFDGATRQDELHEILTDVCMIRRRKKDVLKHMPKLTRKVQRVDISDYKQYALAEKEFFKWLLKTHPKKATRVGKSAQKRMLKIGYLKRLIADLKLKAIITWIDEFLEDNDGKLIVFAVHKKIVAALVNKYRDICTKIDGSVTGKNRKLAQDKFRLDKTCRLIICNLQAGGVGWNGQVANNVLKIELGWTPGEHSQAEKRADRIGQKLPVTVTYLIGKNTIEEDWITILNKRQQDLDQILDGEIAEETSDLLGDLENLLIKRARKK